MKIDPFLNSESLTRWVDLVFVSPNLEKPKRIIWIELKDLGRSTDRIISNAKGLGHDLAALYHLNTVETKRVWMTPPPHVVDKGRKQEWHELAPSLDAERHSICQIILAPEMLVQEVGKERINQSWLKTFELRARVSNSDFRITMSDSIADGFVIFALVAPLPVTQAN